MKRLILKIILFIHVIITIPLYADNILSDPDIPDREYIEYTLKVGKKISTIIEKVRVIEEQGIKIYRFISTSKNKNVEVRLIKELMSQIYYSSQVEKDDYNLNISRAVKYNKEISKDEILVFDMSTLVYSLRGFPFKNPKTVKISILNSSSEDNSEFQMKIKLVKKEKQKVNDKEIDCYKLELVISGMGIFDVMIPKTYFWFSVDAPHYLVCSKGKAGLSGSSKYDLRLLKYSIVKD